MRYEYKHAIISPEGLYRYSLTRSWDDNGDCPMLGVFMLNPSTADAKKDDPTICAIRMMAKRWGFSGFHIGNLFGWRSSSTVRLQLAVIEKVAVGLENDLWIRRIIDRSDKIMVGWGGEGAHYMERVRQVEHLIRHMAKIPYCIGVCENGQPKHPLLRFHTREQKVSAHLTPWVLR